MPQSELFKIMPQLPGFISLHSPEGTLVWASRISYGLSEEILGQPADANILEEDRPRWWEAFRRAGTLREVADYVVRVRTPTPPGYVTIQGRLGPVLLRGRLRYVAAVCWDATFRDHRNPLARFLLSHQQRAVVAALLQSREPMSGKLTPAFRDSLARLVQREILAHDSRGYRVSEAFSPYAYLALMDS